MIFAFFNLTLQFFIKHFNDEQYISGPVDAVDKNPLHPSNIENSVDFEIVTITSSGDLIIKAKGGSKVWDIGDNFTLTYYSQHGKENQQFALILIGNNTFIIKNRGRCIEYNPNEKKYFAKECLNSDNQKFKISTDREDTIHTVRHIYEGKKDKKVLLINDEDSHLYDVYHLNHQKRHGSRVRHHHHH